MSLTWPAVDRRREATGDDAARDLKRAAAAAADVLADYRNADKDAIARVARHLADLKHGLTARLMGAVGLTSFKRASLTSLLNDVDRLILQTQKQLADYAGDAVQAGGDLGTTYATAPIAGAGLTIQAALPGLDDALVTSAFETAVSLLSPPMRKYADQVKQAVRRVTLAGEGQFAEIQRLAKTIEDGGDAARYKAERIIRTEVGRVFNEATYARGVDLAKEFPFLMKGWRASRDNRTRKGHVEAAASYGRDGGLIPFASPFKVKVYDERPGKSPTLKGVVSMRFPIDPEATPAGSLAASATIMCRCNAFIDFDPKTYRAYSQDRLKSILSPGTVPPPVPPTPKPAPKRKRILPPAPAAVEPDTTIAPARRFRPAADVRKDLTHIGATAPEAKAIETAQKRLDAQQAELKDVFERTSAIAKRITAQFGYGFEANTKISTDPEYVALKAQQTAAQKAVIELTATRNAAKRILAAKGRELVKVDPATRPKLKVDKWIGGNGDRRASAIRGFEAFEELVGVDLGKEITVRFHTKRSTYSIGERRINMGTDDTAIVVHELGHFLEDTNPEVHRQAIAFLVRRTAGDKVVGLRKFTGMNYKADERATPDGFADVYTGKWYNYQKQVGKIIATQPEHLMKFMYATEVVSMGLQKMYEDPIGFQAKDPDFFDFIYNLTRGTATESFSTDPADWNHVPGVEKQEPASKKKK